MALNNADTGNIFRIVCCFIYNIIGVGLRTYSNSRYSTMSCSNMFGHDTWVYNVVLDSISTHIR